LLTSPYLIDIGFLLPIAAVGYQMTARFTGDASALQALRLRLESLVEDRTRALAESQERLARSEKLAALGRLAAGVSHEVNNPAAAVAANLRYLQEHALAGTFPEDAQECIGDSLNSVERIKRIVRQLSLAGRFTAPFAPEPVRLAWVAREGLRACRAGCGGRVALLAEVGEDLFTLDHAGALIQVLIHLVANGVQAIPAGRTDGRVVVRGERVGQRVRLVVEDNGAGMAPDVHRRLFEPFFSTKPFGDGFGLGLAVSRGLVQGLGGELTLENATGGGARAVIDLPEAASLPP
jgi:C4-dicarboxylate-specific signal transduction histidine kinase